MRENYFLEKFPQGRALDQVIHNKHMEALSTSYKSSTSVTATGAAVTTPVGHLTTLILLKSAISSNSKFFLVSSKSDMKELTIIPNYLCLTISLASNALKLRSNESIFIALKPSSRLLQSVPKFLLHLLNCTNFNTKIFALIFRLLNCTDFNP